MWWSRLVALGLILVMTGCQTRAPHTPPSRSQLNAEETLSRSLAHYSRGIVATRSRPQDHVAAARHFEAALSHQPDSWRIAKRLVRSYKKLERHEDSQELLERICQAEPDNMEAFLALARSYQDTGNHAAAVTNARTAIHLSPTNAEAHLRLLRSLISTKDYPGVLDAIDAAAANTTHTDIILTFAHNIGRGFAKDNRHEFAAKCFARVLHHDPDNLDCLKDLRNALSALKRLKDEITAQQRIVELSDDIQQKLFLGTLLEEAERYDEALLIYEPLLTSDSRTPDLISRVARAYLSNENTTKSVAVLTTGIEAFPENPSLLALRAMAWTMQADYLKAIADYEDAEELLLNSEIFSVTPSFYYSYGAVCERAGKFELAEKLLLRCIDMEPKAHHARNYLAYMWAENGHKLEEAYTQVTRALKDDPENGAYLDTLGWILFQQREFQKALPKLLQAGKLMPGDPIITEHIGDCYRALDNPAEALTWWNQSLKIAPDNVKLREKIDSIIVED